jgi:hypothetical protein
MVLPQGGMRRSRAFPRGSKRRRDAIQTRVRGGCSGGGWPRPSGQESFCSEAISPALLRGGWMTAVEIQAKHVELQAAMNRHLSQPIGDGALVGQHGMSSAISSGIAAMSACDIASGIGCIEVSAEGSAITGRETGAAARPAIIKTASRRRMVNLRITGTRFSQIYGERKLSLQEFSRVGIDRHQAAEYRTNLLRSLADRPFSVQIFVPAAPRGPPSSSRPRAGPHGNHECLGPAKKDRFKHHPPRPSSMIVTDPRARVFAPRRNAPGPLARDFRPLRTEGVGNAGCRLHRQPRARKWWLEMLTSIRAGRIAAFGPNVRGRLLDA